MGEAEGRPRRGGVHLLELVLPGGEAAGMPGLAGGPLAPVPPPARVIGDGPGLLAPFLKELVNALGAGILCLGLVLLIGSFRRSF